MHIRSRLMNREEQVNGFVNPPSPGSTVQDYSDNTVFQEGSEIGLAWSSDFSGIVMNFIQVLDCAGNGPGCDSVTPFYQNTTNTESLSWVVDASPHNLSASNVFYFTISNNSASSTFASFRSHYFNISSSSTGTSPSVTGTHLVAVTADETTQSVSSDSDLSSGAEIGIGLGIGISFCSMLLCVVLVYRWFRRYRARSNASKRSVISGEGSDQSDSHSRRPSWAETFEMNQKTPDEEHSHHSTGRQWISHDEEAPSYEPQYHHSDRRGRSEDMQQENTEERTDIQDRQFFSPTDVVCEAPSDSAPSYESHLDSYAGLTNPQNSMVRAPSYESSHSQYQNDWLVSATGLHPPPLHDSERHPNRNYRYTTSITEIRQPVPSYDPWRHHELLHRTASSDSIQHTPDQELTRFYHREVKRGTPKKITSTKKELLAQQPSIINPPTSRPNLKNNPKRKSRENTTTLQQTPHPISALQTPPYNVSRQLAEPSEIHQDRSHEMTTQRISRPSPGIAELPDRQTILAELEGSEWKYL